MRRILLTHPILFLRAVTDIHGTPVLTLYILHVITSPLQGNLLVDPLFPPITFPLCILW